MTNSFIPTSAKTDMSDGLPLNWFLLQNGWLEYYEKKQILLCQNGRLWLDVCLQN